MDIAEIQRVLLEHETKYHQQPDKIWKWSCACGADKLVDTRQLCVMETRRHLAETIAGLDTSGAVEAPQLERVRQLDDGIGDRAAQWGLDIMSELIREVDMEMLTMPQARHALGEWFKAQDFRNQGALLGRERMRRLKQITDAVNEEFMSLLGSQS